MKIGKFVNPQVYLNGILQSIEPNVTFVQLNYIVISRIVYSTVLDA